MKSKRQHLMPVFVGYCYFLYDFLDVLVGSFHRAVHLWSIWRRIMMFDLELCAKFSNHSVVQICAIVSDNPFRDAVPTNEIVFDEPGHHIFGDRSKRSCFYPLCEVVNSDQDKAMSVGGSRFDFTNHINTPHCKRPRSRQDA